MLWKAKYQKYMCTFAILHIKILLNNKYVHKWRSWVTYASLKHIHISIIYMLCPIFPRLYVSLDIKLTYVQLVVRWQRAFTVIAILLVCVRVGVRVFANTCNSAQLGFFKFPTFFPRKRTNIIVLKNVKKKKYKNKKRKKFKKANLHINLCLPKKNIILLLNFFVCFNK